MVTLGDLNKNLLDAEYAVRGPIVTRAQQLEEEGRKIIYCNVGNPQALQQKPLTFIRQMLSLLEYPELLNLAETKMHYPVDVVQRAKAILAKHPHGTGAYSQSAGIPFIRQAVADFIARRDDIPTKKEQIILTDGASKSVQAALIALLKNPNDGFMVPIPQYPLYSASITLYGGKCVGYFLDEQHHWQLSEEILESSYAEARTNGIHPVAIVVINPGNPTGAVLTKANVEMVVRFAKKHKLAILADEVYQENIYAKGAKFFSFAKVMHELNERDVTLFSFHSVSKGFLGECGHRGGYMEYRNVPDDVAAELIKLQSISLCSNITGQLVTYMMVSPPKPGDASYDTYVAERDAVLSSLKRKAEILGKGVNEIEGMSVEIPEGAMYAFIRFELPADPAIDEQQLTEAERIEFESKRDSDYCLSLLEKTGICVVPGSGFGQLPHTLHFRTTFLPPENDIRDLVAKLKVFHASYRKELVEA
ncbi:MAG TPA: aminotransferase class I/II-fold pyridoxal phosphate-dependent enzyme [Bacteroidota bacterium]|nr:aminotransferase class I/II-fold pyridoxal phosphate-dependent enzyme [Bacteroidota bacterium]